MDGDRRPAGRWRRAAQGALLAGGLTFFPVRASASLDVAPPSGPSAELLATETRRRVSDEVKRFLEERCPQQCDVGEVSVKVVPRKAPVGATPGFEELTPGLADSVVERVDVSLMLDKRLTNDFRSGLRTVLGKKLEAEGLSNALHESLLRFPTPQDLPEKPQPSLYPPQPQPQPQPRPEAEKKADPQPLQAAPTTQLVPARSGLDIFLESLPLLIGLALCALVVWFTLRQFQRLLERRLDEKAEPKKDEAAVAAAAAGAGAKSAGATVEERRELERLVSGLKERLGKNRPLAREVMKDLLQSGSPADAALAVVMVSPSVLDGVRGDPDCRNGLLALDDYLAVHAPEDTPATRRRVLGDLERRILRVQVARGEEPTENAFAFLRDLSGTPALFVRLLSEEPAEAQAVILRHAPSSLVHAFVEQQSPAARERLVRPLLESAAATSARLNELSSGFQEKLSHYRILERGDGKGEAVGDLLQAATPDERREMLSRLRDDPGALSRALGSFVAEDSLHALDAEVLSAAMATHELSTAALFVSSLDALVKKRLLATLPSSTAHALAEEAELVAGSTAKRASARRMVLESIRRLALDRGIDLAEVNRKVLHIDEEVAS